MQLAAAFAPRPGWLSHAPWLNRQRLSVYSKIFLLIYLVCAILWLVQANGSVLPNGQPIGTDFINVYAASDLALEGKPALAYDWPAHHAAEQDAAGSAEVPYYGWHYPPMFLILALPLALLPYLVALAIWMAATLPLYLAALHAIVPRRETLWLGLAFPGVFANLGHGQNGFLTAALLGGGLLCLQRRPVVAGLCFGLLTYKPQFGVLIPLVLIATGQWRAFVSASLAAILFALTSLALFGLEIWTAFFESLSLTRSVVLEAGSTGWQKLQSIFAAVRMWGGDLPVAYAAQLATGLAAAVLVVWLWRRPNTPFALKAAGLTVGALLATPYVLDYDLIVLALAIAWLAAEGLRTGFLSWEKPALVAAYLLPLLSRGVADLTLVPLGPIVLFALMAIILRRALHAEAAPQQTGSRHESPGNSWIPAGARRLLLSAPGVAGRTLPAAMSPGCTDRIRRRIRLEGAIA